MLSSSSNNQSKTVDKLLLMISVGYFQNFEKKPKIQHRIREKVEKNYFQIEKKTQIGDVNERKRERDEEKHSR